MVIFKYELRQMRTYIIAWSVALAVTIFVMLPTYMGFLVGNVIPMDMLSGNAFFESIGVGMKYLGTGVGVYGFLTAFTLIAAAINGAYMGLNAFTKEYMQKSADFLMTKPKNRTKIYMSKLMSAVTGAIIIGIAYILGSFAAVIVNIKGGVDWKSFALIAFSFMLVELFFLGIGVLAGTLCPRIRSPLAVSAGFAFFTYILGAFSRKTNNAAVKFLSPYVYFDNARILDTGSYNFTYMLAYGIFLVLFIAISHQIFIKKDIIVVS